MLKPVRELVVPEKLSLHRQNRHLGWETRKRYFKVRESVRDFVVYPVTRGIRGLLNGAVEELAVEMQGHRGHEDELWRKIWKSMRDPRH